jgi:hypothetical protein
MILAGYIERMGRRGMHTGYRWKKPEGKRPLRRPRRRRVYNVNMDFKDRMV